jgi:hypothetical protein
MGKPDAPKAPDPKETAAAQTSTNVATAIANSWLGNINQVTPDGKLTYNQTGQNFINDPNGQKYWYNSGTGKYTTSKPQGAPTTSMQGNGQPKFITNDRGIQMPNPAYKETKVTTPGSAKGWEQVTGYYIPTFTATQTLSPQQQAIKGHEDKAQEHLARTAREQAWKLRGILNDTVDTSKLPKAHDWSRLVLPEYQTVGSGPNNLQKNIKGAGDITRTYGTDFGANVQQVQDAMMSRLQPNIDRDRAALETNLQNQGIRIGSDAWTNAMADFDRGVNDQRTSVLLSAGQEQSRLAGLERDRAIFQNSAQDQQYGQNANNAQFSNSVLQQIYDNRLKGAGFNNSVADQEFNARVLKNTQKDNSRQRALQEAFALRNQPINEISSLLSGAQVTPPNFMNIQGASIPTVDYAGIVQQNYANQMGAYNSQMANYNGILGGLFGLGASGIMASDRRLKRDIRRIGTYRNGLPKYEFRYRHGRRRFIGLMSDDVRKFRPEAVTRIDGYDVVNYRKALA